MVGSSSFAAWYKALANPLMNLEIAVDIIQTMVLKSLMMVAPFLITAIVIGVAISIIQTVTSIQDQTLTFVPKIVGIGIIGTIIANWMISSLSDFTADMFMRIAEMAP